MNWRNKYKDIDDEISKILLLKESLDKSFLNGDLNKKEDLSDTAPPEKLIDSGDFFLQTADTFLDDPSNKRKASENIPLWRKMSNASVYIRWGLEQIINEAIVFDGKGSPVKINFDKNSTLSKLTQSKVIKEWDWLAGKVLRLKDNIYSHFKLWYHDGIIIFEDVYDNNNIRAGIKKVKLLDPQGLTFGVKAVRNTKNKSLSNKKVWYYDGVSLNASGGSGGVTNFVNNPFNYNSSDKDAVFLEEQISFSTSDVFDFNNNTYLSYLNFAVRPLNQLFAVENAFVVFALTRSTDKLVYYVDIGNMPEPKVKARIQEIARENSTTAKYDSSRGSVIDAPDKIKLTNEIYMARRNGTKGTEISSLSASTINFGDIGVLTYLKDNLDMSLFIPRSRRNKDYKFQLGYAKEIDYEELAFYKFILKLRNLFLKAYLDILGKHLIAKKIITEHEWINEVKDDIQLYIDDSNDYERMKYIYDLQEKIAMVDQMSAYVKLDPDANDKIDLFDIEHDILKNVFQWNEEDIKAWRERMGKIKDAEPDTFDNTDQEQDINQEQDETLFEIYQNQIKSRKDKDKIIGDISFGDLDTFADFFEYLKEDDEVVVKRNGKITNLKWSIANGELIEK